MNATHIQFQNVFHELYTLTIPEKVQFLDALLFYFTLSARGIWSATDYNDKEKVEAFKWLNELSHRIWNIKYILHQKEENDYITSLYENMKYYGERSTLLNKHLVPSLLGAFENYKRKS